MLNPNIFIRNIIHKEHLDTECSVLKINVLDGNRRLDKSIGGKLLSKVLQQPIPAATETLKY